MSNTSKVNLSNQSDPRLAEVLDTVDKCCADLGIDFYILGALARDVWYREGEIPILGTKDVDFAILIRDVEYYDQLKTSLESSHGFTPLSDNELAFLAKNGLQIDILPFGQLEVEDGEAIDVSQRKVKVNGLNEVYLQSVRPVYLEEREFKVATLPGIFLLKIIAYDDRPEHRPNDPEDCMSIINNYFELQQDLIYSQHSDLFGDSPLKQIAARVIGRELRTTLNEDKQLRERAVRILQEHIALREKSQFVLRMATSEYYGTDESVMYLEEILIGIGETAIPTEANENP